MPNAAEHETVIEATRRWLEKSVIGLNLCPFAGTPWRQGRVRFRVSEATGLQQLAEDLADELLALQATDPAARETTLLIHPHVLDDFFDYNDFLDIADGVLEQLELDGTLQVASFHPDYRLPTARPTTRPIAPTGRPTRCFICCEKPASRRRRRAIPIRTRSTSGISRRCGGWAWRSGRRWSMTNDGLGFGV